MDKSNNSITRLAKKAKTISNVMNISISLNGMLTQGHKIWGCGHFNISFVEMGSNFIVTSLEKCLKGLEEPMVD